MAYDFVIGVDVGKYFHHACVLDPQGRQVLSKRINQHKGSLRKLFGQFLADNTSVLVIVDQPNNISRLTVAVAQDMGQTIAQQKLKNALWQSSSASTRFHERSQQFYERKRKEGKRHNAAVVALARRHLNVLFAMMRNGELYRDISTVQEAAAA